MNSRNNGELPEELHRTASGPVRPEPTSEEEPEMSSEETERVEAAQVEPLSNGWLLLGIFLLLTIGVLMLLIFASGGNADSSMML